MGAGYIFKATSSDSIVPYQWNNVDTVQSDIAIGYYEYNPMGMYEVFLTVTNEFGCTTSISTFVYGSDWPNVDIILDTCYPYFYCSDEVGVTCPYCIFPP